jgi:hypothetical protein
VPPKIAPKTTSDDLCCEELRLAKCARNAWLVQQVLHVFIKAAPKASALLQRRGLLCQRAASGTSCFFSSLPAASRCCCSRLTNSRVGQASRFVFAPPRRCAFAIARNRHVLLRLRARATNQNATQSVSPPLQGHGDDIALAVGRPLLSSGPCSSTRSCPRILRRTWSAAGPTLAAGRRWAEAGSNQMSSQGFLTDWRRLNEREHRS